jgi:hypothetical protein
VRVAMVAPIATIRTALLRERPTAVATNRLWEWLRRTELDVVLLAPTGPRVSRSDLPELRRFAGTRHEHLIASALALADAALTHALHEQLNPQNRSRLALLAACRFLTADDIVRAGVGAADLEAADAGGCLLRLQFQRRVTDRERTGVLALSRAGARELARAMELDPASVSHSTRSNSARSAFFLDHTLGRNSFALALAMSGQEVGGVPLLSWEHDRDRLSDSVSLVTPDGEFRRQPLEADGLAICRGPRGIEGLLVEIDRGTEPPNYLGRKYAGYLEWWRQGRHIKRFDVKPIRILTVAPDERRSARLRHACLAATNGKAGGLFWFGSEEVIVKQGIASNIWSTAKVEHLPLWS